MITTIPTFLNDVHNQIVEHFVDQNLVPGGIKWANARFEPPAISVGAIWASVDVVLGEANQVEFGTLATRRTRVPGYVQIVVYTQPDAGDGLALVLAEEFCDHFRGSAVAGAQFRMPSIEVGGLTGGWWSTRIRCPFYADRVA